MIIEAHGAYNRYRSGRRGVYALREGDFGVEPGGMVAMMAETRDAELADAGQALTLSVRSFEIVAPRLRSEAAH